MTSGLHNNSFGEQYVRMKMSWQTNKLVICRSGAHVGLALAVASVASSGSCPAGPPDVLHHLPPCPQFLIMEHKILQPCN